MQTATPKSHESARPQEDTRRRQALENTVSMIEKEYGKGAIMRLGEGARLDIQGISTGALSLDIALGGKGVPRGRVVEIFGPEASGKTTLCLHIIANAQKAGGVGAFIDVEHALDPAYAKRIGVNLSELLISQPEFGEQALEIAEHLVRSNAVDVIVVDSVAALVPKAEIEGEMGDAHMGLQARLMSQALRKLAAAISKSQTCVIFTNQIRQKIGVMFGNPETTPGGMALKFYASVRIETRRVTTIKEGETAVGNRIRATVAKNKIAPPYRKAEFDVFFHNGISREGDIIDLGVEMGVIERSGTWFSFNETRLGQGREKAREFLKENPRVTAALEKEILKRAGVISEEKTSQPAKLESTSHSQKETLEKGGGQADEKLQQSAKPAQLPATSRTTQAERKK